LKLTFNGFGRYSEIQVAIVLPFPSLKLIVSLPKASIVITLVPLENRVLFGIVEFVIVNLQHKVD
jgi:hypothetical protein